MKTKLIIIAGLFMCMTFALRVNVEAPKVEMKSMIGGKGV